MVKAIKYSIKKTPTPASMKIIIIISLVVFGNLYAYEKYSDSPLTGLRLADGVSGSGSQDTYYIATNGSDKNDGTSATPWATFKNAIRHLKPGDTLIIKDGTYYQTLNVNVSGIQGHPITIRAENDGQTVVDGQMKSPVCNIIGTPQNRLHDIVIEGVRCQRSSVSVVMVNYSDRIILRRVSACDAGTGNYHVFDIYRCSYILLEDNAASGSGRVMYDIYESPHVTLRRCWCRWMAHSGGGGPNVLIQLYGSDDDIVENCIGTMVSGVKDSVLGFTIGANIYNASASRNQMYGNIVYGLTSLGYAVSSALHTIHGNKFSNNVSIANGIEGFYQRADDSLTATNFTIIGTTGAQNFGYICQQISSPAGRRFDSDWHVRGTLKNSILMNGQYGLYADIPGGRCNSFSSICNAYYNLSIDSYGVSQRTGDISVNPDFNTATYGKGAYLFPPQALKTAGENKGPVGAEILYRYQDGSLTTTPLWPWPMENRILKETGISVTWEANGGLWKTLDGVYTLSAAPSDQPIKERLVHDTNQM